MRKNIGDDEVRERYQSPINASMQNTDYSDTLYQGSIQGKHKLWLSIMY